MNKNSDTSTTNNSISETSNLFAEVVAKILRPIVRLALEKGITLDGFADITKRVFIDVASEHFLIDGRKQTKSRIATLTGINRKEVARIQGASVDGLEKISRKRNRAAQVLTAWLRDERFLDSKGDPMPLKIEGENSFTDLVKSYSGDIPVRTIVDEFKRLGLVESNSEDGRLYLVSRGYVPKSGSEEYLEILGADSQELLETIISNMQVEKKYALYQKKVVYTNVPLDYLAGFRSISARMSQHLLEEMDRWLADHDRDTSPNILGEGKAKVGLGIYQIESIDEADHDL
ncbi:MAG: hypothetical protein KUG75_13510 [Pseudomonadales bacterium]|nr:hypothetical protein [Pseudomonadales bacterium]